MADFPEKKGTGLMDKRRLFLTSTGRSFCENNENDIVVPKTAANNLNELKEIIRGYTCLFKICSSGSESFNWDEIEIHNDKLTTAMKPSAEIDSLKMKGVDANDQVILLCSMTVDCLYSGLAVKKYLIKNGLCQNVKIEVVEGLVEAKNINFGRVGLPSFLNLLYKYVKEGEEDGYKIILNPTGGYKALFSAMTIVGLICGLEIIYYFEKSENLVTIPPLPLHVNIPAWTQIESLVEVLEGKTDYFNNSIYNDIKGKIEPILIEKDGQLESSALVKAFYDYAHKERGKPELITRTENSPLLTFLGNEQREIFLRLTEIGHLIWKGDRVPEMADHALRHHNDLFHIAERLLLPIFYYKKDFLEPHELFVLLCALYLHDCGHVIGAIKKSDGKFLRLLPTEIRDHHHVLGYLRLKYPKENSYLGCLIYDHLCRTAKEDSDREEKWNEAWKNYLYVTATLGLYHRKKMKLVEEKNYGFFKDYPVNLEECDKDFPCLKKCLEKSPMRVFHNEIKFGKAALLVALLRIIDSLDEQVSRTGDLNDIKFHLAQLEAEAAEEKRMAEMLGSIFDNSDKDKIDGFLEGLKIQYMIDEGKSFQLTGAKEEAIDALTFRGNLKNLISGEQQQILALEYASAYVGHFFKEFQKGPYGEKAYIQGISIKGEQENRRVKIKIDLEIENSLERLRLLNEFVKIRIEDEYLDMSNSDDRKKYKKKILENLEKEYLNNEGSKGEVVKDILFNAGIELQYGEEDE